MRNISQGALKSIRLPRRDVDRQVADIQTYRALDDHVKRAERAVHDQRKRHVALRRAVLAAAFSGRLTGASADSEVIEEAAQG